MAWLVTVNLPKEEPFMPPSPDDPDYDPDDQATDPMGDAAEATEHLRRQRAEDDVPMPGPVAASGPTAR